ncbi:MAG: DUF1232 domain-containing protein [Geodermatophilaceae bacterium]|nr:DUF1232 domain-containing protein [Geodermatophilaceae bacterium]
MSEQSWKPLFRAPTSSLTKVLRSSAFLHSRERSAAIMESPSELRSLANLVEALDYTDAPLSTVADRVVAGVRFLRSTADRRETDPVSGPRTDPVRTPPDGRSPTASTAARERLVVASLHYLITPDDVVPDFRAGGYVDDVLLLTWVSGAAVNELAQYLDEQATD